MIRNYIDNYIFGLQSQGRYTFAFDEIQSKFPKEKMTIHMALNRLIEKNRIVRVRNGFYVIVPAEYAAQGILPASLFIDDLMKFLQKPYYVALLSAAALHGAAHQQPQVFMVMTVKPVIRALSVKKIRINFTIRDDLPESGIEQKKTDTGYIWVSNPVLTAFDLIRFERLCGGFGRLLEVMNELCEVFNQDALNVVLKNDNPLSVVQRFGFICEHILHLEDMAEKVERFLDGKRIHPVTLSRSSRSRAGLIDKRWRVIRNVEWEDVLFFNNLKI